MYLGKSETNSVVTLPVLLYKILPLCRIFLISLDAQLLEFLAELFRGMLFKWKGENKKSHQK